MSTPKWYTPLALGIAPTWYVRLMRLPPPGQEGVLGATRFVYWKNPYASPVV